jgi:hypothetical protein
MVRVPDDKEIGRVCREDLLQLVKQLASERNALAAELLIVKRCPACAAMPSDSDTARHDATSRPLE